MRMRNLAIGAALAAVIGTGGYAAFAQGQGPGPGGPGANAPPRGARMMARMCDDIDARTNARLAFAETRLGITAQQREAWTAFATRARAATEPLKTACAQPRPTGAADLPQRMALAERFMAAGLESIRVLRPAVEQLQAALTPEQRELLNRVGPGMGMGMRGGFHR